MLPLIVPEIEPDSRFSYGKETIRSGVRGMGQIYWWSIGLIVQNSNMYYGWGGIFSQHYNITFFSCMSRSKGFRLYSVCFSIYYVGCMGGFLGAKNIFLFFLFTV